MNDDDLVARLREQGRTAPGVNVDGDRVWQAVERRRQRRLTGATAGAVAAIAAAAVVVGSTGGLGGGPQPMPMAAGVEVRGVAQPVELGDLTARDVAAAQTAFGLDLLQAMCVAQPDENVLISPTSAAQALGMVQPAAGGRTARELADLLHLPGWSPDLVAGLQQYTAAIDALAGDGGRTDGDPLRLSELRASAVDEAEAGDADATGEASETSDAAGTSDRATSDSGQYTESAESADGGVMYSSGEAGARDLSGQTLAQGRRADGDRVRMSNRLWLQEGARPSEAFLDGIATAYGAGLEALDFEDDPLGSTDRINEVVADETAGLVPRLLDEPLTDDTRAVLTNAIHLTAKWETPFDRAFPAPFAAPGGEVDAELMSGGEGTARTLGGGGSGSAEAWTSVEIPYADGTLSAVAVLPPVGTEPCAADAATLENLAAAPARFAGVTLPRLRLDQSHELTDVLEDLGMPRRGDFSGFGAGPLRIARVVQKTVLDVDEEGTEAAAATAVHFRTVSAPVAPPLTVVVDRPFLLMLTDTQTRSPLFLGVVHDPTAD